jgi:hypothetical protein
MENYRVVLLSRYKSAEVLSKHTWYLAAFVMAVLFALQFDSADQQVDIWPVA